MEAIILTELEVPTFRVKIPEKANTETIGKDLDMNDELREVMSVHIASYQQRIANLYNKRVKQHAFRVKDLVLRRVFENTVDLVADKF